MALPPRKKRDPRARETDKTPVNERIRARELRVVTEDGEQLGIMSTPDALAAARERGMDLVEVASTSVPPVARILDYGKFKYQAKKKQQEAKKKQVIIQVKEIKLRPATDQHDFDFKLKHAQRFLDEGDKVKIEIRFRGREIVHIDVGRDQMNRMLAALEPHGTVEQHAKMEGRALVAIVASKSTKH
jgi:translation initiation factor IF-3